MSLKGLVKKILSKSPTTYNEIQVKRFEKSHKQDFSNLNEKEKSILNQIQNNGFVVLSEYFDKTFCDKCIEDIKSVIQNHKNLVHNDDTGDQRVVGIEELSANIKKFSIESLFLRLANAYNTTPTVNAFTLSGKIIAMGNKYGSGGPWHRDSFLRQFKSIIYLNDVNEDTGPFQIIPNSHKISNINKDTKLANLDPMQSSFSEEIIDKILKNEDRDITSIIGKAGSVILVDTSCIHRGKPVKIGTRYALTNYYFEKSQINSRLVEHFSPIVSPEKVLSLAN